MSSRQLLADLWETAPPEGETFSLCDAYFSKLPIAAQRYITHAIPQNRPLASVVRLKMHGEFRMKDNWIPFTAEQVIRWDGEMLWRATMHHHGMYISGYDSVIGGKGHMEWKLFGLFPVAVADGPEVTRSAIGRIEGESIWLPSLLYHDAVEWESACDSIATARISVLGEAAEVRISLSETGGVEQVAYKRWGNPDAGVYHYTDFGAYAAAERMFEGYTIPTSIRAGWYFGTERFETEGEFFRATIDEAHYR